MDLHVPVDHIRSGSHENGPNYYETDTLPLIEQSRSQEPGQCGCPDYYPSDSVPRAFNLFHPTGNNRYLGSRSIYLVACVRLMIFW